MTPPGLKTYSRSVVHYTFAKKMMEEYDELNRFADNFIIDELHWHLIEERFPISIVADHSNPNAPRVVYQFENGQTGTQEIIPGFFTDHWADAADILKKFPSLPRLSPLPTEVIAAFQSHRDACKEGLEKWKRDIRPDSEPGAVGNEGHHGAD
jgi:hypothetical protein